MRKYSTVTLILFFFSISAFAELEDLKLLSKGRNKSIDWSMYLGPKESKVFHILLILKNTNAKFIELEGVKTSNITFKDSLGGSYKVLEVSVFKSIHDGAIIMTQITMEGEINLNKSYSFEFKGTADAIVPVNIVVDEIKVR